MTPKELERKYKLLLNRRIKINDNIDKFRITIKDICHHPKEYLYKGKECEDDGYGLFKYYKFCECLVCSKKIS